jgi:uncharacterized protein YbgA (DUF1722 family)
MKPKRTTAKANVLMHLNGYFSDELSQEEKAHFPLDMFRGSLPSMSWSILANLMTGMKEANRI